MAVDAKLSFWGNPSTIKAHNISDVITYRNASQVSEIVVAISPHFRAVNAVLADYPKALVARPCADYARSLSANTAPTSYLVLFDYRTAFFATDEIH